MVYFLTLDFKAAFDSVECEVLWQCFSLKGKPKKYINFVEVLHFNTIGQVKVYRELSTSSGVPQNCSLSPLLFNFVIDIL